MAFTRRRQILLIGLFAVAGIVAQFDRQSLAPLKPILDDEFGWSEGDYANIVTLYQGGTAFALLFAGSVVDRIGVRWSGPVAVLGWSLSMIAHGWARGVIEVGLCRAWLAAFQALGLPAGLRTLSAFLSPANRPLGFGISNAAASVGGIMAPLVLPLMAVSWGWRASFMVLAAIGVLWVLCWFAFYRPPEPPTDRAGPERGGRGLGAIIGDRKYQRIAIAKTLSDMSWWFVVFWLPDFFHRAFGLDVVEAGPYVALVYFLGALGALAMGLGASRRARSGGSLPRIRLVSMLIGLILVVPLPLAAMTTDPLVASLVFGVALFGHQGFSVTVFAIIADQAEPNELGRALSLSAFCGNIGGILVAQATGLVIMAGWSYLPIFTAAPLTYAIALLIFRRVLLPVRLPRK